MAMKKGQWSEKNIERLVKLKEQKEKQKRDNTKQSNKATK